MAAVVFPAIIVMDKAASAFLRGVVGHRQAGRLIGQEMNIPKRQYAF
jgi:hypothetical protein